MSKILVIAEKPAAGADIAKVLGVTKKFQGYYENEKYIVTWAIGHLIELKKPEEIDEKYRKWNIDHLPLPTVYDLKIKKEVSAQFQIIKSLIKRDDIEYLINAGDAGREGYLIQTWIYRMAGNKKPIKVLWASSLTEEALKKAFANLKADADFKGLLEEAETRALGDQKYGFNYSRLLTLTKANSGTFLPYGRCQTPLLNLIVTRDQEIEQFKSKPYYCVEVTYNKGFKGALIDETGKSIKFDDRFDADTIFNKCKDGKGVVKSYLSEEKQEKAPLLYSLDELQIRAGKKYGFTPDYTLSLAQSLYEKHKIMSYPRTDSQYLTYDLFNEITEHLEACSFGVFKPLIEKLDLENLAADKSYFNDSKVTDHHALIPATNPAMAEIYRQLSQDEKRIFDEVILSLIAIFYPSYRYLSTQIVVDICDNDFLSTGTTIKRLGYKEVFSVMKESNKTDKDSDPELQLLPELREDDNISIDNAQILDKKTLPPKKYTPATVIKVMKSYGIGTTATRAEIIKKLQHPKHQYIVLEKGKYTSTNLGRDFIDVVPEELKKPELTKNFEEQLKKINAGELDKESFLEAIDKEIQQNIIKYKNSEGKKIGTPVSKNVIGKCPKCGKDIVAGKKNYYCSGYNDGCDMAIWKVVAEKELTQKQVKDLLEVGITSTIKGFKSKTGNNFDAQLILDEKKKVTFKFPNRS